MGIRAHFIYGGRGSLWRSGIADDVRYYGEWMRQEAAKRIGHLYPKVTITKQMAEGREDLYKYIGKEVTVIAYIWARTVPSPDLNVGKKPVLLIRSFKLSKKSGAWIEPIIDHKNNSYKFKVRIGEETRQGTINRGKGVCLLSDAAMGGDYIKSEAKAGRMGSRLLAVVADGRSGRLYLSPTEEIEQAIQKIESQEKINFELCGKAADQLPLYSMTSYSDIFSPRQLTALTTFSDLVETARLRVLEDARATGWQKGQALAEGGADALAYADAIATYLAFAVDRSADYWSSLCSWHVTGNKIRSTFFRQALQMNWDYAETNPFSNSTGCWAGAIEWVAGAVETLPTTPQCRVDKYDARNAPFDGLILCTDPPYYDNINYADISDFFYIWLKRSIGTIFPKIFSTVLAPSREAMTGQYTGFL